MTHQLAEILAAPNLTPAKKLIIWYVGTCPKVPKRRDIAAALGLSIHTVDCYITQIRRDGLWPVPGMYIAEGPHLGPEHRHPRARIFPEKRSGTATRQKEVSTTIPTSRKTYIEEIRARVLPGEIFHLATVVKEIVKNNPPPAGGKSPSNTVTAQFNTAKNDPEFDFEPLGGRTGKWRRKSLTSMGASETPSSVIPEEPKGVGVDEAASVSDFWNDFWN